MVVSTERLSVEQLREKAREIRCDIIRMLAEAGSGHPGGSLSAADFATALYFSELRHDPQNPFWEDRDRVVFSKGHIAPLLYTELAHSGYFPCEELMTLRKLHSRLQGHPHSLKLPGVEVSTGSLGQGLSAAVGMALGLRLDGKSCRVYCIVGDGETQEGSIWEAAMSAGHYKLDNLCGILDYNKLQIDGWVEQVMGIEPVVDKWRAFRWHVIEIDGHDMEAILAAFQEARETKGKPSLILAHTVKGKGVSFMENVAGWHGKAPTREEAVKALEDLGCSEGLK
ncbi:MAG: transketolase [Chloroflexi bacterium]|nr:transketolase [Chloroflexota bacterium]MCL5075434.1 transketolase [Chloroflexota bacterium]